MSRETHSSNPGWHRGYNLPPLRGSISDALRAISGFIWQSHGRVLGCPAAGYGCTYYPSCGAVVPVPGRPPGQTTAHSFLRPAHITFAAFVGQSLVVGEIRCGISHSLENPAQKKGPELLGVPSLKEISLAWGLDCKQNFCAASALLLSSEDQSTATSTLFCNDAEPSMSSSDCTLTASTRREKNLRPQRNRATTIVPLKPTVEVTIVLCAPRTWRLSLGLSCWPANCSKRRETGIRIVLSLPASLERGGFHAS